MAAAAPPQRRTAQRAKGKGAVTPRTQRKLQVIQGGQSSRMVSIQGTKRQRERDAIAGLDDDFLICRTEFHRWETKGFYDDGLVTMFQMCERCGTERTARYTRNGRLEGTRYKHPQGYEIHGHGPIERYKLRAERFARVTMYRTEDEMMKHVMGR